MPDGSVQAGQDCLPELLVEVNVVSVVLEMFFDVLGNCLGVFKVDVNGISHWSIRDKDVCFVFAAGLAPWSAGGITGAFGLLATCVEVLLGWREPVFSPVNELNRAHD